MTLTSGICRGCRDNVGGIKCFYAANVQDVNSITKTNGIVTAIDCSTWYFFEPNKYSSNWSDTANVSVENGTNYYEQAMNVLFGKYEQSIRDTLEELASAELIVVVKDNNDNMWLLGDEDNGIILTGGSSNSGTAYGDFNGINLTFSRFCSEPACEVQLDDDYDLRMSMVPCGIPAPPNYIRYITTQIPDTEVYNQWVEDNTDTDRNTTKIISSESQPGRRITLYDGKHNVISVFDMPVDSQGEPISEEVAIIPLSGATPDAVIYGGGILIVVLKEFGEIIIDNYLQAEENTEYSSSAGTWEFENIEIVVNTYEVTLYLHYQNTTIPDDLFAWSKMSSIDLNTRYITHIGKEAFERCSYLTSIEIPSSVIDMDTLAFVGCVNLITANISSSLTSIPYGAFRQCMNLETITIPEGVTSIGDEAFYECPNLTSATCHAVVPPTLGSYNFGGADDTLYVPAESVAVYQANSAWNSAFTTITAIQ